MYCAGRVRTIFSDDRGRRARANAAGFGFGEENINGAGGILSSNPRVYRAVAASIVCGALFVGRHSGAGASAGRDYRCARIGFGESPGEQPSSRPSSPGAGSRFAYGGRNRPCWSDAQDASAARGPCQSRHRLSVVRGRLAFVPIIPRAMTAQKTRNLRTPTHLSKTPANYVRFRGKVVLLLAKRSEDTPLKTALQGRFAGSDP